MNHLGDITKLDGGKIEPVDCITFPFWLWLTERMAKYLPAGAALGSLFDGIGGFPLCWETVHGKGTARWASEIEEFPIAVTRRRVEKEKIS